jgi:hypothetical protein
MFIHKPCRNDHGFILTYSIIINPFLAQELLISIVDFFEPVWVVVIEGGVLHKGGQGSDGAVGLARREAYLIREVTCQVSTPLTILPR